MEVKVQNLDLSKSERTAIDSDYSSGTTLTVVNNEGFTSNWYVVVGEPGQDKTETQRISSTTGSTTITIASALNFAHAKGTPVYLCEFNTWAFERKPTGGSYAAISGSPFSIEWDDADKTTTIVITGGVTTDTYKWRPYNSITGTYGSYSDELAGTGLTRSQVGYLIQQVKKNSIAADVDDDWIIEYFNDFQDLVYNEIPNAWWFTKEGTAVATTASAYKFNISTNWSDFVSMKYLTYRYISGSNDVTYPLSFVPPLEFRNLKADANQATDDYARQWTLLPPDASSALGYIGISPTPKTTACYVVPVYQYSLTDLDSSGDTVAIPLAKGYVDYALYRIYDDISTDTNKANKYEGRLNKDIVYLKRRASRQKGQSELFRFRGHRGFSKMYGEQTYSGSSEARELYW